MGFDTHIIFTVWFTNILSDIFTNMIAMKCIVLYNYNVGNKVLRTDICITSIVFLLSLLFVVYFR